MGTLTEVFSNFLLFFLVFGMSATVDIDRLRKQLNNRHALLTGIAMQFLILPMVGFVVVKLFKFSAPVGITLLVVTSSPGGSYSNWWCSLFNAELALSVTMTALSTMVSVIMLPVNLLLYASVDYSSTVVKSLDWYALFMSIFVVIGGISSGLFCSAYFKDSPRKAHRMRKNANRFGNLSGLSLISYSILVSSSDHKAALWDQSWEFFVGLSIPALVGITTAAALATRFKLDKPERVAVAVESCYQNTGIATSVAAVMFDADKDSLAEAMCVPLFYGIVEMVLLATFCIIAWKAGWTKAPADEKLCVVLATSYEVPHDEDDSTLANSEVVLTGSGVAASTTATAEDTADCEKADNPQPPIVFEQTENSAADDESVGSGPAVLRRVDTEETVSVGEDPLSPREHDEVPPLAYSPPSDSDLEQEMDGSKKGVGRLGKTISFVKARATGYRRAPVPDGEGDAMHSPARNGEPGTGIPESGELPGGYRHGDRASPSRSPEASPKSAKKSETDAPVSPIGSTSDHETEAAPAEGKTID